MVDGAGRLRAFWEVIVPVALPGIATTAILTFVYSWNEFLFALSFTLGPERQTVPVAIALFRGQYQVPWGQVLAAAIVATAPVAVLVLVGPSGCGKSTALRMIAGLETPTGGKVVIGDRDVTELPPQDRDIAMVFQSYALYPHMTVRQNLGF